MTDLLSSAKLYLTPKFAHMDTLVIGKNDLYSQTQEHIQIRSRKSLTMHEGKKLCKN